jgi:hypothetical protein
MGGFWNFEDHLRALSAESDPHKGCRPPFDAVWTFKMLVLQALHGLSLQQIWVPPATTSQRVPGDAQVQYATMVARAKVEGEGGAA